MRNYRLWREAVKAFKAFKEYDDIIYKTVGDYAWHSNPINDLFSKAWENHMNTILAIVTEGKETDYWKLHEKFNSPASGDRLKPVAWYKTQYNITQDKYKERKGMSGFIPEQLEEVFLLPERRGYVIALSMYNDLIKIEKQWRKKNETKTISAKRKTKRK
jgi:hypothetical protein